MTALPIHEATLAAQHIAFNSKTRMPLDQVIERMKGSGHFIEMDSPERPEQAIHIPKPPNRIQIYFRAYPRALSSNIDGTDVIAVLSVHDDRTVGYINIHGGTNFSRYEDIRNGGLWRTTAENIAADYDGVGFGYYHHDGITGSRFFTGGILLLSSLCNVLDNVATAQRRLSSGLEKEQERLLALTRE